MPLPGTALGAPDDGIGPRPRHRRRVFGDDRIGVVCRVLVAHHRRPVALEPNAPEHGVAGERRVVAAAGDETLDRLASGRRPVLVVPGADHEPVAVGDPGDLFEVARDRVVEVEAGALGPFGEAAFVREPAGRAHVAGEPVLVPERLVPLALDVGLLARVPRR